MAGTGQRDDPFSAFNFRIEIDGITIAAFSECSGLSMQTDPIEYRTGQEDITVRKLPGLKKFTNIVMKRGLTKADDLWKWRKTVMDGKTERKNGSIVLLDESRQDAIRWNFREGWPTKLDAPTFNAKTNEVAVETLEIAIEDLQLA
jgi:phage tail-like protein